MKKVFITALLTILAPATALADFSTDTLKENFYVGAGFAKAHSKLKKDYGEKIFAKNQNELHLSAGTSFNDLVGVELGYIQQFKKKKNDVRSGEGERYFPGSENTFTTNEWAKHNTNIKGEHHYLGLTLNKKVANDKLKFTALLGTSVSKIKGLYESTENDEQNVLNNSEVLDSRRTFKKRKLLPLVKISSSYRLHEKIDFKVFGMWKQLSKFKIKSKEESPRGELRLKDSYSLGAGITFYPF